MTLTETKKLSKHMCRLLKVHDITWTIARTSKGNIGLMFNIDNDEYEIMLDSVPLSTQNNLQDENNIELKKMIEKYYFQNENTVVFAKSSMGQLQQGTAENLGAVMPEEKVSSKRKPGRPSKK